MSIRPGPDYHLRAVPQPIKRNETRPRFLRYGPSPLRAGSRPFAFSPDSRPQNERGRRSRGAWRLSLQLACLMGRLRACCRLRRLLAPPPPQAPPPPPPGHPLSRGPHATPAHGLPFSRPFSSASAVAAVAPHEGRDSGLGGSAYWAWIRAATESAPAPTPPHEEEDDGPARYIPVKAYFLSTR